MHGASSRCLSPEFRTCCTLQIMGCSNLLAVFVHAASVLVAPPRAAGSLCTPNFCSNVTCKPIEASECNGKVEANATDCGCCEKCIVPLGLGAQSRHSRSVVKIGARHELEGSWPVPSSNLSTVRTLMKGRTASHRKRGIWCSWISTNWKTARVVQFHKSGNHRSEGELCHCAGDEATVV
ncbi:uncharacterized protein [Dermacentor albipictus]|uniref:uncharacterized protein isoform X2 n=1 Tax=Dermacentor albipictus TaxID=60249 RepID=UPI0038FD3DEF